jgi:SET domain-containing protein
VFATGAIPKGTFIKEYVGELLHEKEQMVREAEYAEYGDTCCVVNIGSKWRIDPTRSGNVGRFINHSCEPNLLRCEVYGGERRDNRFPRFAFFAARDLAKGEELTWFYPSDNTNGRGAPTSTGLDCSCGSKICQWPKQRRPRKPNTVID